MQPSQHHAAGRPRRQLIGALICVGEVPCPASEHIIEGVRDERICGGMPRVRRRIRNDRLLYARLKVRMARRL